jgi:signal transduction histidine kinase
VQEQQQFLSLVLRGSPGGILVLDFDGRISLSNPAAERLLQRAGRELQGQPFTGAGGPLAEALAALQPGQRVVVTLWGGKRVRAQHGTFLDRGFRRSFFLLEELTEELRQSEKSAYEKLIRLLSHEVNNTVGASNSLLHSSLSYAPQLAVSDRGDFEQAIGVVIARTEQLSAFMRSFADVVRLPPPRREPSEPAELVDSILGLVRAQADARRIAVIRTGEKTLGPVSLDRVQIEQALLNLVKNGLEAIDHDGTLTVRLLHRGGQAAIEIDDTGPGIQPDLRPQLFTPFFSTKEGGQGIGLTMVQEILGNHGFGFSLDAPPGGPTRATVVLQSEPTE